MKIDLDTEFNVGDKVYYLLKGTLRYHFYDKVKILSMRIIIDTRKRLTVYYRVDVGIGDERMYLTADMMFKRKSKAQQMLSLLNRNL